MTCCGKERRKGTSGWRQVKPRLRGAAASRMAAAQTVMEWHRQFSWLKAFAFVGASLNAKSTTKYLDHPER